MAHEVQLNDNIGSSLLLLCFTAIVNKHMQVCSYISFSSSIYLQKKLIFVLED